MNKPLIAVAAALALLLIGSLIFWTPTRTLHQPLGASQAVPGGDFTLRSPNGFTSLHDYKGKVVLLYFGYTFCPDICPTSLGFTSQALSTLTPDEAKKVQMLFVTVDPERDTLDKLKTYTAYFHPNILGLTGTPEEIKAVARQYGVMYAKQDTGSAGGYVVDHSAYTYVITPDGSLFKSLDHGTPPAQVLEAIRAAMSKN